MIVDAHTHIMNLSPLVKFDWDTLKEWFASEPKSKCVIMPKIVQSCNSVSLNADFLERLKAFPQKKRVFPFLWIHPNQLMEEHFKQFTFSGFKFHPSISQSTVDENPRMIRLCEKYKKPILIHCGRNKKSRIDYVLKVNQQYPRLKFICAHMGGLATDLIIRAYKKMVEAKYVDNIYLDTAGCFLPKLIEKAVELLGNDKIIFGTDRPFHSYKISLYAVNCCNFDRETKKNILSDNILKILSAG